MSHSKIFLSIKRTHDLFINDRGYEENQPSFKMLKSHVVGGGKNNNNNSASSKNISALVCVANANTSNSISPVANTSRLSSSSSSSLSSLVISSMPRKPVPVVPKHHLQWKLSRVISGHTGWVRSLAVDPTNEWFASGSTDRCIKIWDLAKGTLKLTLTGHISPVRGLAVSGRQPYLFSCGEDKMVKCWDLEYNKVIRHYHGHLSAVHAISLHPAIDVLVTGGRDKVGRLWDMRSKAQIHSLSGHDDTIGSIQCQSADPQVITGSHDSTIRLWDIVAGKTRTTLTHHKKSVRALQFHPSYNMFISGAADNLKQWICPEGQFSKNLSGLNSCNCLAVNQDDVIVSGANDGSLFFWDWKSGHNFQKIKSIPQPGSMESDNAVFATTFDMSGTRLLTGECDKTIKVYKMDETG